VVCGCAGGWVCLTPWLPRDQPKSQTRSPALDQAELEFKLKKIFRQLLDTKEERWRKLKDRASRFMLGLSHNYSGKLEYATVETDEGLEIWFRDIANQIQGLE